MVIVKHRRSLLIEKTMFRFPAICRHAIAVRIGQSAGNKKVRGQVLSGMKAKDRHRRL